MLGCCLLCSCRGDFPVVWTNTKYWMVYINMGHGDECFSDATQNLLFVNALRTRTVMRG